MDKRYGYKGIYIGDKVRIKPSDRVSDIWRTETEVVWIEPRDKNPYKCFLNGLRCEFCRQDLEICITAVN